MISARPQNLRRWQPAVIGFESERDVNPGETVHVSTLAHDTFHTRTFEVPEGLLGRFRITRFHIGVWPQAIPNGFQDQALDADIAAPGARMTFTATNLDTRPLRFRCKLTGLVPV